MFICDRGTGAQQFRGLVMSEIHRWRPVRYKFEFSFVGNDRRPSQNLGRVGKIETLPILQICPRPSQTIGDIYYFEFSLVGKIWDSQETVKSPIVWDFPDIWNKQGFKEITPKSPSTVSQIRYGFRTGARAIRHSVNTDSFRLVFSFRLVGSRKSLKNCKYIYIVAYIIVKTKTAVGPCKFLNIRFFHKLFSVFSLIYKSFLNFDCFFMREAFYQYWCIFCQYCVVSNFDISSFFIFSAEKNCAFRDFYFLLIMGLNKKANLPATH